MSKQSTNSKSNTHISESTVPTSNRFDVLSSKGKTNRKTQKKQSNQKAQPGFDHPNWRHPVNKAQELYTRTPKQNPNQLQRRRLFINTSVTEANLVHCNSRVPINGHWKLPNNTYEKQAYLHWSKENSLAFKRNEPQIPYDPWQYIRRIKADARKRQQKAFEKEAWSLFQDARLEWIKANPKLSLPDWLADYDQAGWIKEVNKRLKESQRLNKKQAQKEKKQQRQPIANSEDQETALSSESDPTTSTEQPIRVKPKKGSPRKLSIKKRELAHKSIAKKLADAEPADKVETELTVAEKVETQTKVTFKVAPVIGESSEPNSVIPTHEFFVFTVPTREPQDTLDRLTDELCKFQVDANILADQYPVSSSESAERWNQLLERLHQWVDSNSPNKDNLHENVLALFSKIVRNVQERQVHAPGQFDSASAIPLYIYKDQLEATRKQRARLLWCLEVTNFIVAKTPVDQIPARVLSYDEVSYLAIAKQRETLARKYYFAGKSIKPATGCTLPPLPAIPPPQPHSSLGLWMVHQYQVDEALRRAVDPTGTPLDITDERFLLQRLREEAAGLEWYKDTGISPPVSSGEEPPVWPPAELQSIASQDFLPTHSILEQFINTLPTHSISEQFINKLSSHFFVVRQLFDQAQLFDQLNTDNNQGVDEGFVDDWGLFVEDLQKQTGFEQAPHWDNPRCCCESYQTHLDLIKSGEHPSDVVTESTPPLEVPIVVPELTPNISLLEENPTLDTKADKDPFNFSHLIDEIDRLAAEGIDDTWERAIAAGSVIAGTKNIPHEHGPGKCDCANIEDYIQQYQTYKARLADKGIEETDILRWDRITHLIQQKQQIVNASVPETGEFNAWSDVPVIVVENSIDETGARKKDPPPAAAI
jgi:hypothetical protein